MIDFKDYRIYVIGQGYVGLSLAIEFGKKIKTFGFDIDSKRISKLICGIDENNEVAVDEFKKSNLLTFGSALEIEKGKNSIFIVTVPTPIDRFNKPNLDPLFEATKLVGSNIRKGDYIIYESTVFPGCTEEICVPILEKESQLKLNKDFYCGYSPERINPGDKKNTIKNIKKIVSGSNDASSLFINELYQNIVEAGTYLASSIKVAEAAKIIENCQRDINISFANEITMLLYEMGISSSEVFDAASTKWNFLPFKAGLVGGHCIAVDPYYLIEKAENTGFNPKLLKASRKVNSSMPSFISKRVFKELNRQKIVCKSAEILVLGFAYKRNSSDIKNTGIIELVTLLKNKVESVDVFDPMVNPNLVKEMYRLSPLERINKKYDAIVLAIEHDCFLNFDYEKFRKKNSILIKI